MNTLTKMYVSLRAFKESEDGATAIEYGLIAALIAVAIITAVTLTGTNLGTLFTGIAGKLVLPGS